MSGYSVLQWWWYLAGGGGGGSSEAAPQTSVGSTLILPEPGQRYDRSQLLQMQLALQQHDAQVLKKSGDIYHPHSLTVRRRTIFPWVTFGANDTTPSVAAGRNFRTANTQATTITDFDDALDGQEIVVRVDDAFTTFDFTGSGLVGNAGADYAASNGDRIHATYDAAEGVWYCQVVGV